MEENALLECSFGFKRICYIWLDFLGFVVFSFFRLWSLLEIRDLCTLFLNRYEKTKQNKLMDWRIRRSLDGSECGVGSS